MDENSQNDNFDREKKKKDIFDLSDFVKKKIKKKKKGGFEKGHNFGVRFGSGQNRGKNGRKKGVPLVTPKTIFESMKGAAEQYGLSAYEISLEIIRIALDKTVDEKVRFPFLKEANLRIFGAPIASIEEFMKIITQQDKKTFDMSIPALEATVQKDGIALVKELVKQGKLEEVLEKIKEESASI